MSILQSGRFRARDRILDTAEYQRIQRSGRRLASRCFAASLANEKDLAKPGCAILRSERRRLGIVVSRRVGNAVVRNRVKRCIREWFRVSRGRLEAGSTVVVVARPQAARASGAEISRELCRLFGVADSPAPVSRNIEPSNYDK